MAGELSLTHFGWLSLSGMAVVAAPGTPLWLLPALGFVGHICYDVSPELQSQLRPLLSAAGSRARDALPAPARRLLPATDNQAPGRQAGVSDTNDDPLGAGEVVGDGSPSLPPISLAELARSPNILIVGSPGSGKSTLLHALVAARPWRCYMLDPHSHPGKWPGGASVIGGGRGFQAIYQALQRAEATLDARAKQLNAGAARHFPPFSLAGDEWGSVTSEIVVGKDEDAPGRLLTRLLKEGRKFGISFLGAAHGDTATSLGSAGDTEAFRYCFDAIVYMGGFVTKQLKDMPQVVRQLPMGRTPEGKQLPLVVVVYSPLTGERRLLDLRGISAAPPAEQPAAAPHGARTDRQTDKDTDEAAAGRIVTATQADRPAARRPPAAAPPTAPEGQPSAPPLASREDLVRALVRQGWGVSQVREVIKGDNKVLGELVRRIEDELIDEGRA